MVAVGVSRRPRSSCRYSIAYVGGLVPSPQTSESARRFALNVIVATIPAVVLGLMFEKAIKSVLFAPVPVAFALVGGGLVILWVENRLRGSKGLPVAAQRGARVNSIDEITPLDAFKVGCAQCFALIPGMSRSGSTIIGAMLFGLERRVATEFSFFLAIPVIFGATVYELYKSWHELSVDWLGLFGIGFVAAFVSAFDCDTHATPPARTVTDGAPRCALSAGVTMPRLPGPTMRNRCGRAAASVWRTSARPSSPRTSPMMIAARVPRPPSIWTMPGHVDGGVQMIATVGASGRSPALPTHAWPSSMSYFGLTAHTGPSKPPSISRFQTIAPVLPGRFEAPITATDFGRNNASRLRTVTGAPRMR